eukprot:NODE_13703_length_1151_cov_5.326172.p1 GENE.NODE_13703_length_1151_cov_5.326172~~NODE_13703_length_1151_cov_5.326172.p1  ORF type:complete len:264 (+),score=78.60 NODE_13703_length_1151_cov_5.326172:199-990(+)
MSAVRDGDHYVINGQKKWITNGTFADFFTVAARTGPGQRGISLFTVAREMGGITTRAMKCSGVWSSGTAHVTFENMRVPATYRIGEEGHAFKILMENFNHERWGAIIIAVRFARILLDESFKHAQRRTTFGKLLVNHPVIRWKLGEMARQIEACHLWLEWTTYQMNTMTLTETNLKLGGHTALLKAHASKVYEFCAREAAQIYGGLGYTRGGLGEKVERLNRDMRAFAVAGGSEEMMIDIGVRQSSKLATMAKMLQNGNKAKL